MTHPTRPSPSSAPLPPDPVRLFRLPAGSSAEVLLLSPEYGGLLSHWFKGETKYCRPEGCPGDRHKAETFWRGYGAVLISVPQLKTLTPAVLEITDKCELDFRGRWRRGDWWRLTRAKKVKGKNPPTVASWIGSINPDRVPPPFDCLPVLMHVFNETLIELNVPNPMPARVLVATVEWHQELFQLSKNGKV